jgi:Uma2 family endonuclease
MVTTRPHTVHELWNLSEATERYELIEGELFEVSPTSFEHGEIQMAIGSILRQFVNEHRLGKVVSETGFVLSRDPDTVLGPTDP